MGGHCNVSLFSQGITNYICQINGLHSPFITFLELHFSLYPQVCHIFSETTNLFLSPHSEDHLHLGCQNISQCHSPAVLFRTSPTQTIIQDKLLRLLQSSSKICVGTLSCNFIWFCRLILLKIVPSPLFPPNECCF